jgi:hypothetical protein
VQRLRVRAKFTEADISRILKAAAKAHVDVRVKIDTYGNILIANTKDGDNGFANGNPWDDVLDAPEQKGPS